MAAVGVHKQLKVCQKVRAKEREQNLCENERERELMRSKAESSHAEAPGSNGRTVGGVEAGANGGQCRGKGQHAAGGLNVDQEVPASDAVAEQDERTARKGRKEMAPAVNSVSRPGAGSAASGGAESAMEKTETVTVDRW